MTPLTVEFQLNSARIAESAAQQMVAGIVKTARVEKRKIAVDVVALKAAATKCYDCYQKDVNLLRSSKKADALSALELGRAFVAMRELCTERGHWAKWLRSFGADKNRINYCIRVAEKKVGKKKTQSVAPEKPTNTQLTAPIIQNVKLLLKLSQHGNRPAAQNLIANIVLDLERFLDDNFPKADEQFAADSTFGADNCSIEPPATHRFLNKPLSGPLFATE